MQYQIDERVIHWTFGPGKITAIDKKTLSGKTRLYYVFETEGTTLWVPVDDKGESSLRAPTPKAEFFELLEVFDTPGELLPDQQYQRQTELVTRMRKRTLYDVCCLIRDLTARSRAHKLNRYDTEMLKRAAELLLNEWELAIGADRNYAQKELERRISAVPAVKIKAQA
ncbi:MAG TPA: CarD family transcriptional regulator [Anaerolineales bacterium]|nr:CarD family transcriptional regulator [Anaerolineales bacterium]